MTFVKELLFGGDDYRVTSDIGGAVFAPSDGSEAALNRFQTIAERILANDGYGYTVVKRLIHPSSDHSGSPIDRIVINIQNSM
jgi:hypothetical protein